MLSLSHVRVLWWITYPHRDLQTFVRKKKIQLKNFLIYDWKWIYHRPTNWPLPRLRAYQFSLSECLQSSFSPIQTKSLSLIKSKADQNNRHRNPIISPMSGYSTQTRIYMIAHVYTREQSYTRMHTARKETHGWVRGKPHVGRLVNSPGGIGYQRARVTRCSNPTWFLSLFHIRACVQHRALLWLSGRATRFSRFFSSPLFFVEVSLAALISRMDEGERDCEIGWERKRARMNGWRERERKREGMVWHALHVYAAREQAFSRWVV